MTVVVSNLTKRFRRGSETVTALDDVSLVVNPGELTVAAGPSGSGKTTLLSIIAGFETADAGSVRFESPLPTGAEPLSLTWRHLAFVPQALALLDELSVQENVDLPALLDPDAPGGVPAEELLARLEIQQLADRYPSMTSGGEQQRTAVARALAMDPQVILADEPSGNLDRWNAENLHELLSEVVNDLEIGMVVVTHSRSLAGRANQVLLLDGGKLSPTEVEGVVV